MDSTNNRSGIDSTYRLLALCARAESHPAMLEQLSRQIEAFTHWDELPTQAEVHGMGSLLRHHLKRVNASLPHEIKRALDGLYLRHRKWNETNTQILLEITSLFEMAGIRALVLKGLALAHQYYPEPALRPASDIDLLLKKEDVLPALDFLQDAGFRVNALPSTRNLLSKELTVDSPPRDGLRSHIELHHYDPRQRAARGYQQDDEFKGFEKQPHSFTIGEGVVYVPSPMDTLNYLLRHFERHLFEARDDKPLQLKWITDIISLVERHAAEIDWAEIKQNNPALLERLDVFYSLSPLPLHLAGIIPVEQTTSPAGINQYPQGWPQNSVKKARRVGFLRFLLDSLKPPSNWWLRLYYGIPESSCFLYGQFIYRIRIFWYIFLKWIGRN
jgi:hypothetical protein